MRDFLFTQKCKESFKNRGDSVLHKPTAKGNTLIASVKVCYSPFITADALKNDLPPFW